MVFYCSSHIDSITVKDLQPVVNISLRGGKKSRNFFNSGLTCLCDSGSYESKINPNHKKPYKSKIRANRDEYSIAVGPYSTARDDKVPFIMSEFSSRNIITHFFHVDNKELSYGIVYDMIMHRDLMVKKILEWDETAVSMKGPGNFSGKT